MFAVINHLHLAIPVEQVREGLEADGAAVLAAQPGFRAFHLVRESEDRATVVIFWDDAGTAANGAKVFGGGWFARHIAPFLASDQQRTVGEVVLSR